MGLTYDGNLTLSQGKISPFVASGTGGPEEFDDESSSKLSGFSPAHGHSKKITTQFNIFRNKSL